jgi:phenylpropionate dioxygenase-like ring-hydroxylating dioxygenase large terminal subunit
MLFLTCVVTPGCPPSQVLHGLLWLYPDHSGDAWLAAIDAVPAAASAEVLSGEEEVKSPWFQRDVPLSLDTVIENFMVSLLRSSGWVY